MSAPYLQPIAPRFQIYTELKQKVQVNKMRKINYLQVATQKESRTSTSIHGFEILNFAGLSVEGCKFVAKYDEP